MICFVPDTGHVLPLLRLARLVARQSGAQVTCFLPARFERTATSLGFAFRGIDGLDLQASAPLFESLSRKSIFYTAFSNDQDLLDGYWAFLHEAMSDEVASVVSDLDALRPSLVLADTHVFDREYRRLAARLGARLVMSRAVGGASAYTPRRFERVYGLSHYPAWWQSLVEIAGNVFGRLLWRWRRLRHAHRCELTEKRMAALKTRVSELLGPGDSAPDAETVVSAGIAAIEHRVAKRRSLAARDNEILLAPLVDAVAGPISDELQSWLEQQHARRIVYVCFGTMVRPPTAVLRMVLDGLQALDASVLWAQPLAQQDWLQNERLEAHVRFESFAPQASLLLSGRVDCFVTHAGLGAVQEALLGGVPMFCLPFMWDQPYLASVVNRLGAGLTHFHRRLTKRKVKEGIRELLTNPAYRRRCSEIALELRSLQNAPEQTAWIGALLDRS